MGSRYKTFDSTGNAPNGRLYAGDLNAIEDMKADSDDYAQALNLGTLRIGDSSITLSKFGAAEARVSAALRTDGILRSSAGLLPPVLTTTQRNALAAGFRPPGLAVFNTTTNQWEYNAGTDAVPNWQAFVVGAAPSGTAGGDLTGSFPNPQLAAGVVVNADVNAAAGILYSKLALTNSIVNADIAAAAAIGIAKLAGYPTDGTKFLAGDGTWKVAASGAPSGAAGGDLAGSTYPNPVIAPLAVGTSKIADSAISTVKLLDGSVSTLKIVDNAVQTAKIQDGAVTSAKIADGTIVNGDIADNTIWGDSKLANNSIFYTKIADDTLPVTKFNSKYDRGYSTLFNIGAQTYVDITVNTNVTFTAAPVYSGTLLLDAVSDQTVGNQLRIYMISVSASQCVFRVVNNLNAPVNNVRFCWHAIG